MNPFPHTPWPVLPGVPASLLLLALLGVSVVLIFAGRTLAKMVVFLAVGIAGAAFGGVLAGQYLAPQWAMVGLLLGFLFGGLLGVALLPLGVGLVAGYAAYVIALDLALGPTAAVVAGVAFFVAGALLSGRILAVATAAIGGLLLIDVLTRYGFGSTLATVVAALVTLVGLWIQLVPNKNASQPAASSVGGQPSDHR